MNKPPLQCHFAVREEYSFEQSSFVYSVRIEVNRMAGLGPSHALLLAGPMLSGLTGEIGAGSSGA